MHASDLQLPTQACTKRADQPTGEQICLAAPTLACWCSFVSLRMLCLGKTENEIPTYDATAEVTHVLLLRLPAALHTRYENECSAPSGNVCCHCCSVFSIHELQWPV